ncbi:MAG: ATP-binding protein [Polyangiaceae bacterium]
MRISDTGIGISAATLNRLFEPFFTTKGQGYGLGLTTAQEIVKLHGGLIQVESALGEGTSVEVYLPALDPRALRHKETIEGPHQHAPRHGGTRVLLLDGAGVVRSLLARLLRRAGFEVVETASATDALGHLAHGVDLMLLDFKSLSRSEPQSVLELQQAATLAGTRTLLAIGPNEPKPAWPLDDDHASLLRKPFSFEQLLESVERLLER